MQQGEMSGPDYKRARLAHEDCYFTLSDYSNNKSVKDGYEENDLISSAKHNLSEKWKELNVDNVAQLLAMEGLSTVAELFREHKIDGTVLRSLSMDMLKEDLGIQELGTRLKVYQFLQKIESMHCQPFGSKVFSDPVHGHMEFHPLCVAIIDTPHFQRLRYLKQLGACYFVYPGASNNRFEHSLGVCHLAGELTRSLQGRQPQLGITMKDVLCVQIAGLCHDLGHGPFSHMFEKFISLAIKDYKWEHENMSVAMFDYMFNDPANGLKEKFKEHGLDETDCIFIKEQIAGPHKDHGTNKNLQKWAYKGRPEEKAFLYEIVANKRNGIDVDKWDYFARDCHHLGMRSNFNHTRFIHFARVISVDNQMQICVRDKEGFNMYQMFHTRHALHRKAYQHRVTSAVEIMMLEAMKEANEVIRIPGENGKEVKMSDCCKLENIDAFLNLNDSIIHLILLNSDQRLEKAKKILKDIQYRKLYKCVGESVPLAGSRFTDEKQVKRDILEILNSEVMLKTAVTGPTPAHDHIIVQIVFLDFGMNEKNPVDEVRFYSKDDLNHAVSVQAQEVSHLIPQGRFKEQLVRVFLKPTGDVDTDSRSQQLLKEAFTAWCRKNSMKEPKNFAWIELSPTSQPVASGAITPVRPTKSLPTGYSASKCVQRLAF